MKQVIGIFNPGMVEIKDLDNVRANRGGSETWLMNVAFELAKHEEYHVIVFCNCDCWYFNTSKVEFVPNHMIKDRIQYQKFDHIIISRFWEGCLSDILESNCCDDIYIQAHDVCIGYGSDDGNGGIATIKWEESAHLRNPKVKKIINLTDFHKETIQAWNHVPSEKFYCIPNGITPDDFKNVNYNSTRDNSILWSSRHERGLELLVNNVLPMMRMSYPDFTIRVASYDDIPEQYHNIDGVVILGGLTKEQLYAEMQTHKLWLYPAVFPETFCITALENVMCGCMPVLPYVHGMATTLKPFRNYGIDYWDDNEDFVASMVDNALRILENYNSIEFWMTRLNMKDWILDNYTWEIVVNKWIELWNKHE